ncbi:hypothetical protein TNCV_2740131 [Trichonephila clavipes]|nr:hypothetical protein TNCV_2740131 [Trichonephila clavipes]
MMAFTLKNSNIQELRGVTRFVTAEDVKPAAIHITMDGVFLLHYDARPHVFRVIHLELGKFKWEKLDHPSYSLDMPPYDFHVFCPLKNNLKEKRFSSDDELKGIVKDWVSSRLQKFWEQ